MNKIMNFIGGERVEPASREFLDSFDPSTGKVYLQIPDSDERDIDLAVDAARSAFIKWSGLKSEQRAEYLYRIADLIDKNRLSLAEAESRDQGKPVWLALQMDIPRAAQNFRFFAGHILHQSDMTTRMDESTLNYIERSPVGVAGLISPWNLPLYLLTWKIAPALAYGNTCVAKPSELTSHTASLLCDLMLEAKLPKGVVNIVFGAGAKAGASLVAHRDVPLISFTGGTQTGEVIARTAAPMFKKLSLELGGKNPNIIFDDADLEQAVETTLRSSFLNQGEICLCGSRIYVQRGIFEKFKDKFVVKTKELKVGNPNDKSSFIGALVSKEHLLKVESFIELARKENVQILSGGGRPDLPEEFANGYFLNPTVLLAPKHVSRLQQEEIFGPVVTLTPFDTEDEVIEMANGVRYGLSATVWTTHLKRAHSVARKLHTGTVWVNNWMSRDLRVPFGGVKASGVGSEGQDGSREFFTEAKTICIKHD